MPIATDGVPTPEELGAHSETPISTEAPPPVAEKPPVADPKPKTDEPPAPETPPQDEPEDKEFATVEEFTAAMTQSLEAIEARKAKAAREAAENTELSAEEQRIKALEAENAQLKQQGEQAAIKAEEDRMVHEVRSTAGKLKMSDPEVETVGAFFEKNPALIGVWSFERASLYVLPELQGRLTAAPPAQPKTAPGNDGKAATVIDTSTAGPGTPQPFKHDGRRRDYSDITRSTLANPSELAKLGSY
jgi:hypothetical protein